MACLDALFREWLKRPETENLAAESQIADSELELGSLTSVRCSGSLTSAIFAGSGSLAGAGSGLCTTGVFWGLSSWGG